MKKIITILAIALISFSCSTDETTSNTDCNCGEVIQASTFNVTGPDGVTPYTVFKVKNNCTDVITQQQVYEVVSLGSQYCN